MSLRFRLTKWASWNKGSALIYGRCTVMRPDPIRRSYGLGQPAMSNAGSPRATWEDGDEMLG
jgi:hypothetical protein